MMGLCLGHDMIFNASSKAPVTPLLVKDRKLKHNTLRFLKSQMQGFRSRHEHFIEFNNPIWIYKRE
jgi:uncharacterized metal-binding protein